MTALLGKMPVATNRKPCSALAVTAAVLTFGLVDRQPVQALPGESSIELLRNWRATHFLPRPKAERKYTDDYPDLSSQGSAAGGNLGFSAFLNSNRISTSETIDYRPEGCLRDPYRCSGQVIFQKSGNDLGHRLIAEVFGVEVLEDFMRSDALKTINEPGGRSSQVNVFYAGNRFNYTTWVYSEPGKTRSISQFTVLGKNDAELWRMIRSAETCSNDAMRRDRRHDSLCSSP
jgi:hypothetical protein